MRKIAIAALLLTLASALRTKAQDTHLLGTARTVLIKSDVVYHKDRKFNSAPIPYSYIYQAGLLRLFHQVGSNPDIIIKFHKDVFVIEYETISITVYNAEDNSVLYSEERQLVDEENDVNRLVDHFLSKVRAERDVAASADAKARRSRVEKAEIESGYVWNERDSDALNNAKQDLELYSSSTSLVKSLIEANRKNPNECHVYLTQALEEESADVVLEEKIQKGQYVLTLKSRDSKDVLHEVRVPENLAKRAVVSMERWINSTQWE